MRALLFPLTLLATAGVTVVLAHADVDPDWWAYITYYGAALVILAAEHLWPLDTSWNYVGMTPARRWPQIIIDLGFLFVINPLGQGLRLSAALWLGELARPHVALPAIAALPAVAQIALFVVGADFFRYGIHRMQHRYSWLWRFHALHHTQDALIAIRSSRVHPIDDFLIYMPESIAAVAFGFDARIVAGTYCVVWVLSLFNHANIDLPQTWVTRVLMSTRSHMWHHALSSSTEATTKNYAEMTTLWDRLFGTYEPSPLPSNFRVGVTSDTERTLTREMLGSFYLPADRL